MSLTNANKEMIRAINKGNMHEAQKWAIASLKEDNTKKNEAFCASHIKVLEKNVQFIEMPANIASFVVAEDTSNFNESRFFVSERERKVVDKILRNVKVSERMESLGIHYPNATLLHGVPGVGKTMFGRYVAKKLDRPFLYLNFSQLIDSHMGGTAKNLNRAFHYANQHACVLMLDEVDVISMKRSSGGDKGVDGEISRTTMAIAQEMDTMGKDVVLLAATNRKDIIDPAMMRRFQICHEIKLLNQMELYRCLEDYVHDVGVGVDFDLLRLDVTPSAAIAAVNDMIAHKIERELEEEHD